MTLSQFAVFMGATLMMNITPGTSMIAVTGMTLATSWRHGFLTAIGLSAGAYVHIILLAFGLDIVLTQSPILEACLKWVSVVLLIFMGGMMLFSKAASKLDSKHTKNLSYGKAFLLGMLVDVCNPMILAFFLAFLPPFVEVSQGHIALQFLSLGAIFCTSGFLVNGVLAYLMSRLNVTLKASLPVAYLSKMSGVVLIGMALWTGVNG